MARNQHSDQDIRKLLREVEFKLVDGKIVRMAYRNVGVRNTAFSNGGVSCLQKVTHDRVKQRGLLQMYGMCCAGHHGQLNFGNVGP